MHAGQGTSVRLEILLELLNEYSRVPCESGKQVRVDPVLNPTLSGLIHSSNLGPAIRLNVGIATPVPLIPE